MREIAPGRADADYGYLFDPEREQWLITRDGKIFMPLADHPDVPKPAPNPLPN
jgi:hypothetical protein